MLKISQITSFGHYIKTEREKRECTQTELGIKIGINTSAICRIENEIQKIRITKLRKLAELFHAELQTVTDLFFAVKVVKEAMKYKCSDYIFSVAEDSAS